MQVIHIFHSAPTIEPTESGSLWLNFADGRPGSEWRQEIQIGLDHTQVERTVALLSQWLEDRKQAAQNMRAMQNTTTTRKEWKDG